MRTRSLKNKILLSHLKVIAVLGIAIGILGFYQIKRNVIDRAQTRVTIDLKFARSVYQGEIETIKKAFKIVSSRNDLLELKELFGLDYIYLVNKEDSGQLKSEIAKEAFAKGKDIGGSRIIGKEELLSWGEDYYKRSEIEIKNTPKAKPTTKKVLDKALAMEYALPIVQGSGPVKAVLYGGKIVNRDFQLVDKIRDFVFEDRFYNSRPVGTVTIFLDDTRITTNVLDKSGNRAIGTRVSAKVYDNVVKIGKPWLDRAFVVTDWYLTGYEPIRDIRGNIIGILYVGNLEQPFIDILRNTFIVFLFIIIIATVLAMVLSFILATAISRPLNDVLEAAENISRGNLAYRAKTKTPIRELNQFAESFNKTAEKLSDRDKSIKDYNDRLVALNKSYLDLIGFVSHELKGILSSVILTAYSVRDGFLGMINFKQRKAMDLVTRNLDYLSSTVKNFLSLSRIEQGELSLNPREILIKEDVFDFSIGDFSKAAEEKGLDVINNIESDLKIKADLDLLLIVANNLISNAVKYASANGKIIISSGIFGNKLQIEVYNDGEPIAKEKLEQLFKKFSRLDSAVTRKAQGTGLGLFITKEIIERHKGLIWAEPKASGNSFIFQIAKGV